MSLWILISVLLVLVGLGAVAFLTLLERKLLSLSQIRLGPNKVTMSGLLQPVADGIKLLFKEMFLVLLSQAVLFAISPFLLLVLFIISWTWIIPWAGGLSLMKYSALVFFSLLGLSAYAVILTGWSSVSGFSKLGSLRGMLQSLSFEVAMILVFFICLVTFHSFMMESEFHHSKELLILWVPLWVLLSLMETNRAPFDLLEGESELISGFNIEMGSLSFVFLFLSEYGMIMVLSLISTVGMFGSINEISLLFFCFILFMRSCFPRVRYDVMMSFMWQGLLPISVMGFFFIFYSF